MSATSSEKTDAKNRRSFIGGSDARIIMGNDEAALIRLWREKRGEVEPEDLSGNLIVQLGSVTEDLNRRWYEINTGQVIKDIQRQVRHPVIRWLAATLDGRVESSGAVFEAKFMLPWSFSEEGAADKIHAAAAAQYVGRRFEDRGAVGDHRRRQMGRDQAACRSALSAPSPDRREEVLACVENGEPPRLFDIEPPRPRIEAVRVVDMSTSNAWAEFAALYRNTRSAYLDHERAKSELKALVPEDAKEAIGHGIRARRSKAGAVSFDLLDVENARAPVQ